MLGLYDELPVRLPVIGSDLGEELVVGDTGRGSETCAVANLLPDLFGYQRSGAVALVVDGDIEKSLVEGERLYHFGVLEKDLHDLIGDDTVVIEPWHDEDEMGTLTQRRDGGHGRVNTILACFIAGGRHHSPLLPITHSDGLTAIVGVVALFDGGIEGIHIHMDYLAVHGSKYTFIFLNFIALG